MPTYNMYCEKCTIASQRFGKTDDFDCKICGNKMIRQASGAASTVTREVIDNGVMPKKVEIIKDIEKLMEQRKNAFTNK